MADRNSAEIFGIVFARLARVVNDYDETVESRRAVTSVARDLWRRTSQYDFSDYQLECDDALVLLGLARRGDDGIEYAPYDLEGWS